MLQFEYPFVSYTWTLISEQVAIKRIDKSVFVSRETGIPKEITSFFEIDDIEASEKKFIQFMLNNVTYEAYFYKDPSKSHRAKVRWKNDLEEQLNSHFSKVMNDIIQGNEIQTYNEPLIEFIKIDSAHYEILLRYRGH